LYKKGDIYSIKNYIPISILPTFSKILERLMCNRLIIFLNKHNIITEVQNGFREQKSTITEIHSFTERIHKAIDNGLQATGILFDSTNTHYVLNHKVMLDKLYTYGVRGNII
jgi:hypothetical protein